MRRSSSRLLVTAAAAAIALIGGLASSTEAHKAVTSRFTYNTDVFPILRDNCGRCHVEGGPAPMGLMKWNDGPDSATPWAESIRQSVVGEQMPPWYADPKGPAVKGGFALKASDSDKLLTWTTGGTPEGDPQQKPPAVAYTAGWSGGAPDLKLDMPAEFVMSASESETVKEFVVPTGLTEPRWLKAVDVMPGAPGIVRGAVVSTENGTILSVWAPGDTLVPAPAGAAFRLPAGANLRLQILYKKQWQNEGKIVRDRSAVGLYFAASTPGTKELRALATRPAGSVTPRARVLAVRPSLDRPYGSVTIHAVKPGGAKVTLLRLRGPRPEWRRRYWLVSPVELPSGSRIEVATTPPGSYVDLSGARFATTYPLEAAIDYITP